LIAVALDPQADHEQRGRRPALVAGNDLFNRHAGPCIACPITSTRCDSSIHVLIPGRRDVTGFVMVDQVKSIDYRSRVVNRIGHAPEPVLQEALSILDACIY
jgi:mRNA interferase MazF